MFIVGRMASTPRTILIVDDDVDVLLMTGSYLSDLGYSVIQATNGQDGLRLLEEQPDIDLLFTDVVMPGGIDGYELAHRAVEKRPKLRVIYTSGFVSPPRGVERVSHGRLLPKPWRIESLKGELDRAFG